MSGCPSGVRGATHALAFTVAGAVATAACADARSGKRVNAAIPTIRTLTDPIQRRCICSAFPTHALSAVHTTGALYLGTGGLGSGDWGLGARIWGLGISRSHPQSPVPSPQLPVPSLSSPQPRAP